MPSQGWQNSSILFFTPMAAIIEWHSLVDGCICGLEVTVWHSGDRPTNMQRVRILYSDPSLVDQSDFSCNSSEEGPDSPQILHYIYVCTFCTSLRTLNWYLFSLFCLQLASPLQSSIDCTLLILQKWQKSGSPRPLWLSMWWLSSW